MNQPDQCWKVTSVGTPSFPREENSSLLPENFLLTPVVLGAWQGTGGGLGRPPTVEHTEFLLIT